MSRLRLFVVGCWSVGVMTTVIPRPAMAQVATSGADRNDLSKRHGEDIERSVVGRSDPATIRSAKRMIDFPRTNWLRLEASGLYDSNVLRNDLILGLWRGDVLTEDLRRSTQEQLKGNNRAGYALDFRAIYSWGDSLWGNRSLKPVISVAHHSVMGLRFADDLYNLTFFGNTAYEGSTASLGNTAFAQFTYQTFGFGFHHQYSESYLQLQLVNGQRGNSATLRQADLYTATDGRYLQLDFDGSYLRSDTSQGGFGTSSGVGLALNAAVEKRIRLLGMDAKLQFSIMDLGFVVWNGDSERLVNNSGIHYDGITVQNVFDLDGVVVDQAALQDTLGLTYAKGSYSQVLPWMAQVRARIGGHGKYCIAAACLYKFELSVDHRNIPGYLPHARLVASFGSRRLRPEFSASVGGFGGFRFGPGLQWNPDPGMRFRLHAPNVLGLVSGSASGAGLQIGLEMQL